MSLKEDMSLILDKNQEITDTEKIRILEENIRKLELSNQQLQNINDKLITEIKPLREKKEEYDKTIEIANKHQLMIQNKTKIYEKLKVLSEFFYKLTSILDLFNCQCDYRLFGSTIRNLIINDFSLPAPEDIDIMMYINKRNADINMKDFIILLFKNIWGNEVELRKKELDYDLYSLPFQFSVIYKGIKIDLNISPTKLQYDNALNNIEDTTATSFSCGSKAIYFPMTQSPLDAMMKIIDAHRGKVYSIKNVNLSVPFTDKDFNLLRRMEKITKIYKNIPDFPLLTGSKMIHCPVLARDVNFCPILKCGHYISFEALIKIVERERYEANCPLCRTKIQIIPNIEHCTPQENIMSNSEISKSMITDLCDTYSA